MKRFLRSMLLLGFLTLLVSCIPQQMDLSGFALRDGDVPVSSAALEMNLPRELTLSPLPEGCVVSLQAEPVTLSAALRGNLLVLCSSAAGDGTVTLHFDAKGYRSASYVLPVCTALHPMQLSVDGAPENRLTLTRGEQRKLTVQCTEGAALTAISSDPKVLSLLPDEMAVTLIPCEPGEATVTLKATREGYAAANLELFVTVEAVPVPFELERDAIALVRQGSAAISLWPAASGAEIACLYDAEALTLHSSTLAPDSAHPAAPGLQLLLTANRCGVFPIEITLTADGYLPCVQTLTVTAVDPSVTLHLDKSASLAAGQTLRLPYSVTPSDALLTVSATNGLTAALEDGAILLEGMDAGRATVSLSASADGYRTATASASVLVIPQIDTAAYAAEAQNLFWLTNQERLAAGLPALTHRPELDAPATLRAQEAILVWSHTRPNGQGCETVYPEFGLTYHDMGENLFAANVEDAALAVSEWMASATHRENILRPAFTGMGVGVACSRDGDYYYCQLFVS